MTEPEALVASAVFDATEDGEPYSATIRFAGRRLATGGARASHRETFSRDEIVDGVVPGSGPLSVTTWVYGLEPGEWVVTAELIATSRAAERRPTARRPVSLGPATWSWRRWRVSTTEPRPLATRWALLAPLARQPAVLPGSYTALAIVGFAVALGLQAAILARGGLEVAPALAASGLAIAAGLLGAKAWAAILHPDKSFLKGGWAVDGFLVVMPLAGVLAIEGFDLQAGPVLDAAAPGIYLAVAIGRIGCFLTGCCAGRFTAAGWGIWSSDRRVGARRIPTQLLEAGAGLGLGVATLAAVLSPAIPVHGAVFIVSLGTYALIRQGLLRLRAERRASYATLPLTAAASLIAVVAVGAVSLHVAA